jgi:tetratricopeptide (TPR) repeat protein
VEQLAASGELLAVYDRQATYFVALAEEVAPQLERADQVRWLARLDREDDNLRAVLGWLRRRKAAEAGLRLVRSLRLYWYMRGRLLEGYEQAISFADLAESAAFPLARLEALTTAGFLAREYGDYDRAHTASSTALALSHQLGDEGRAADAQVNLGYVALQRGQYAAARDRFHQGLATNRALGNEQGIADTLSFLALTAFHQGDLDRARRLNEESCAIWTALHDLQATIWARTRLGAVLAHQGEHASAYAEFVRCIDLCRELDFQWGLSWSFDGLAHLAAVHADPRLAARLAVAASAVREAAGIALSPVEQTEADRLLDQLRTALGTGELAALQAASREWVFDDLLLAVKSTLSPLHRAAGVPDGTPATGPGATG